MFTYKKKQGVDHQALRVDFCLCAGSSGITLIGKYFKAVFPAGGQKHSLLFFCLSYNTKTPLSHLRKRREVLLPKHIFFVTAGGLMLVGTDLLIHSCTRDIPSEE